MKIDQCNGCGYCCMSTPCDVSRRLYKSADICPQLQWNEDKARYFCGLMLLPGNIGFEYRKELHDLRGELGLGRPHWVLHLALGYANSKNMAHSKYIHRLIKNGYIKLD